MKTKGQLELEAAGFIVVSCYSDSQTRPGRWFECNDRHGDAVLMLRISSVKWHAFYQDVAATGSGHTPNHALSGGLGDVIGTDGEMKGYVRTIKNAPDTLIREYAGLYVAYQQVNQ